MTPDERTPFEELAARDKIRHYSEMQVYQHEQAALQQQQQPQQQNLMEPLPSHHREEQPSLTPFSSSYQPESHHLVESQQGNQGERQTTLTTTASRYNDSDINSVNDNHHHHGTHESWLTPYPLSLSTLSSPPTIAELASRLDDASQEFIIRTFAWNVGKN